MTDQWHRRSADPVLDETDVESGTIVAGPAVLHSTERAAVALTRVTAVGALLSMEVLSVARGEVATAMAARVLDPALRGVPMPTTPCATAALATIHGSDALLEVFVAQEPARVHHVAAQRVLTDADYRAFFRYEAERVAEIIVDNGVFDLGHTLPAADLIAAARAVAAREIILPDLMRDGLATVKTSDQAARIGRRQAEHRAAQPGGQRPRPGHRLSGGAATG